MIDIAQLNKEQFSQATAFESIKHTANDLIYYFMAPEAYKMVNALEQKLKEYADLQTANPEIFLPYQQILIRLKSTALMLLDDDTFLNLIKNNLANILGSDININERMTSRLYTIPDLSWPEHAQQTIQAVRENIQTIGDYNLTIPGESVPRPPFVKYWLLDYERIAGNKKHANLERAQYFARSRNYKNLSETDKEKIQQLLAFYDGLKPLPLTPEEIEMEEHPIIAIPRQKVGDEDFYREEEPETYQIDNNYSVPPPQTIKPAGRPIPPNLPTRPTPAVAPLPKENPYREEVEQKDLVGPEGAKKLPQLPPRIDGNIVNLKDYGK